MTKEIRSWIDDDNASSFGATLKKFLEVKEYFKSGKKIIQVTYKQYVLG